MVRPCLRYHQSHTCLEIDTDTQAQVSPVSEELSCCFRAFTSYKDLRSDYEAGSLHPGDLKEGLKRSLNNILDPVRKHFETDSQAKDLLKKVKQYRTTR